MSKITKWKPEKTKVKVVFRLQFHATHVPQPGWDKLFITFVPAETGKATAKTNKANVRNGSCKWSDPIYETTRLLQDAKTKKYDEKLYKLVVAMGSSRSSILGESTINLANYAEASKPSSVALSLQGCNSGTVLNVTIQLLTSKTGFREFEQQRELSVKGYQTINDHIIHAEPSEKELSSLAIEFDQIGKVNERVQFTSNSKELSSLDEELNDDCTESAVCIDGSSSYTSESLYAEKHDNSSMHEIGSLKSMQSGDIGGLYVSRSPRPQKNEHCDPRLLPQGSSDWVHGWSSDYSIDNDLAAAYEENSRLRGSLEAAESLISSLKVEVGALQDHANELGNETQSFAEELAVEIATGKEVAKEITVLKNECSKLKNDIEKIKHYKQHDQFSSMAVKIHKEMPTVPFSDTDEGTNRVRGRDPRTTNYISQVSLAGENFGMLEDVAFYSKLGACSPDKIVGIEWPDALVLLEELVREIVKKVCFRFHEKDLGFLQPDLEALESILQLLKAKSVAITSTKSHSLGAKADEFAILNTQKFGPFAPKDQKGDLSEETYQAAGTRHSLNSPHLKSRDYACREIDSEASPEATYEIKEKICELVSELEESKAEQEGLLKKMDQMECYYESLIQELEEGQKQTGYELESLRTEHATCLYTISNYNNQLETMRLDMDEQLTRSTDERCNLETANAELERRAIASETALKKLRWNYSIAVNQLQKDLDLLSFQVLSMFETNESLAKQVLTEASQHCFQESVEHSLHGPHPYFNMDGPMAPYLTETYSSLQTQVTNNVPRKTEFQLSSKLRNGTLEKPDHQVKYNEDHILENERISAMNGTTDSESMFLDGMGTGSKVQIDKTQEEILKGGNSVDISVIQSANVGNTVQLCNAFEEGTGVSTLKLSQNMVPLSHCILMSKLHPHELHDARALQSQEQIRDSKKILGEKCKSEELKSSLRLQEELQCRAEFELSEMHLLNVHLDIFSVVLHGTVHELNSDIIIMRKKVDELMQKLCHASESKEMVMQELQGALDDVLELKESKARCMEECNNLIQKNLNLEAKYEACLTETNELKRTLLQESLGKDHLKNEMSSMSEELKNLKLEFNEQFSLKADLETSISSLQNKLRDLRSNFVSFLEKVSGPSLSSRYLVHETENESLMSSILRFEILQGNVCEDIIQLLREKNDTEEERSIARASLSSVESQLASMNQKYESELHDMVGKLDMIEAHVEKLDLELQDVSCNHQLNLEAEEKHAAQNTLLLSSITSLENELQYVVSENRDLAKRILTSDGVRNELDSTKQTIVDYMQKNEGLMVALEARDEECLQMEIELSVIKENLKCAQDELQVERCFRDGLECNISILKSQLSSMHDKILAFDDQKLELIHLRKHIEDLKLENSKLGLLLLRFQNICKEGNENISLLQLQVAELETNLAAMDESLLVADIEVIFAKTQFVTRTKEFLGLVKSLERSNEELQLSNKAILDKMKGYINSEMNYIEENLQLKMSLESLRTEFDNISNEKREIEACVHKKRSFWADDNQEKHRLEVELECLRGTLVCLEEEVEKIWSSRAELEITATVLGSKFHGLVAQTFLLQGQGEELIKMQNQHAELTCKLSEQISRTEEFKNLCVQLKDLKDKAETECLRAREKKENEAHSVSMQQESLRIAFIREQCETKVQDLRTQLYASKKHGEEMLLKFQDALDEIENRKKNEVSLAKKNKELSSKILDLESDVQKALFDKRELVKINDRMKAELECSMISLDCCKEEKHKLEASLNECNDERNRISVEFDSLKKELERSAYTNIKARNHQLNAPDCEGTGITSEVALRDAGFEALSTGTFFLQKTAGDTDTSFDANRGRSQKSFLKTEDLSSCQVMAETLLDSLEDNHSSPLMKCHSLKDSIISRSVLDDSTRVVLEQEQLQNGINRVSILNEHFKQNDLRSSMERLNQELESLKNGNFTTLLQHDEQHLGCLAPQRLQKELLQLHKANERLSTMFPLFNEFSGGGNALERVLALEVELAESLQVKKKSSISFQSSFLKQHNDEEAVLQSFRDINELIKDMLEMKSRHAAVENELKDMQERYSQLSLQFAEVEGERQLLLMTLKNSRLPKKP